MEVLQLLVSGISQGCVYGLIALGFVLIYKATEMVNFAQGDMMMLGAFFAYTFSNVLGWPFLWTILATLVVMAAFGVVTERTLLRPMIGEP
ncbi:MAG: branched-chain amino acid ABC transporter permease, partial [Pseudomonadales bacterium]